MSFLEEVQTLNLRGLVSMGTGSTFGHVPAGDWRSLLELFTSRVGSGGGEVVAIGWSDVYRAYLRLLDTAGAVGALDEREKAIRSINMLVALIPSVKAAGLDAKELGSLAALSVLEHMPMSREHAEQQAKMWRSLSKEEIQELRYLKNLLWPLKSIREQGVELPRQSGFDEWFILLPSLP